jgi:hypothetical protein
VGAELFHADGEARTRLHQVVSIVTTVLQLQFYFKTGLIEIGERIQSWCIVVVKHDETSYLNCFTSVFHMQS